MGNTYPVRHVTWLGPLTYLLSFLRNNTNTADFHDDAFRLFRQFLALKIAIPFAFADGLSWPISMQAVALIFVVWVSGWNRFYHGGFVVILGLAFYECWHSWPFTINHTVLEFCIVLLICLMPNEMKTKPRLSCADMIKILMLSVWFFSGLHKLFDGYYLNGEFFALETLANDATLGRHLNNLLNLFGPVLPVTTGFSCCTESVFLFSRAQAFVLLAMSWMTILVEIMLPFSLLHPKFRSLGIMSLFVFQAFVTYFSGEIDFAFSAFAILFLFTPQIARFSYPFLMGLLLVVQPWH